MKVDRLRYMTRSGVLNTLRSHLGPGNRARLLDNSEHEFRILGVFAGACGEHEFLVVRCVTRPTTNTKRQVIYWGMAEHEGGYRAGRLDSLDWGQWRWAAHCDVDGRVLTKLATAHGGADHGREQVQGR